MSLHYSERGHPKEKGLEALGAVRGQAEREHGGNLSPSQTHHWEGRISPSIQTFIFSKTQRELVANIIGISIDWKFNWPKYINKYHHFLKHLWILADTNSYLIIPKTSKT